MSVLEALIPPSCSASGTVLDVTSQIVVVQGTPPRTIGLTYVNEDLLQGLFLAKPLICAANLRVGLSICMITPSLEVLL